MSATFAVSAAAPVGRAAAASGSLRHRFSPRQRVGARRVARGGTVYARVSGTERTSTASQMSSQIKDIRAQMEEDEDLNTLMAGCLLYTSPSPRDVEESRMPSSA